MQKLICNVLASVIIRNVAPVRGKVSLFRVFLKDGKGKRAVERVHKALSNPGLRIVSWLPKGKLPILYACGPGGFNIHGSIRGKLYESR